jgi:purine-binding chemotaxis protein CheW
MQSLIVWTVDEQRYAIPLVAVEQVVRAVAITPLPDVPAIICGIINVHGRIIPILNIRHRLQLPERDIDISDQLIIVQMPTRTVGFFVDSVIGEVNYQTENIVVSDEVAPGMQCVTSVIKLTDGLILVIDDLNCLLSLDEHSVLTQVLLDARA